MNTVFRPYLRKIVLVYLFIFYDILVFSSDFETHLIHLRTVLEALLTNHLFAKRSKCVFSCHDVEYSVT